MTVDTKNDIVFFDLFEGFFSSDDDYDSDKTWFVGETNSVTLNLHKYNIDITEYDGKAYMATLNDIFSEGYTAVIYQDEQFSIDTNTFDRYLTGKGIGKYRYEDTRTKEMTEFTYNELCFTMDTNYGYPSKCVLAESIHKNGFDNTFSTYNNATVRIKELLLSESTEDYCTGIKLLNYYLEDGGHTDLSIGLRKPINHYKLTDMSILAEKELS